MTRKKLIFADKKMALLEIRRVKGRADCESALGSNALEPDSQSVGVHPSEILLNQKDKIRMICENLWASDVSAFCFSSAVVQQLPHGRLP